MTKTLRLGQARSVNGRKALGKFELPAHHLLTHGLIVGMTGSGKTGLVTVLVEEALRSEIPVLCFDIKGDMANLALAFPNFDPKVMAPWVEPDAEDADGLADDPLVVAAVEARKKGLADCGIHEADLRAYGEQSFVRVITPGSDAGESLHLLSALERRSARWDSVEVGRWMDKVDGRTPATIVSVAHLDDDERVLVLGVILEEVLSWVRSLPGSTRLKALIIFDEVYGYLPPHPASPPTKKPLVALMKQARAYGVGCVLATQNPMDLDYRALSNAGTWWLGRLQTDADRTRVVEGLGENKKRSALSAIVKKLTPRWFVVKGAKSDELSLLYPRDTMSYLRGPMTQSEIKRATQGGRE